MNTLTPGQRSGISKRGKRKHGGDVKPTVAPAPWDLGATGIANRAGLVVEDVEPQSNPNRVKRARRVDMLETYFRRGWIDHRQFTAGEALRNAWEHTERSPGIDLAQERVDSSPKPDHAITIQIDRLAKYLKVSGKVDPADARILFAVACCGTGVSALREYRGYNHEKGKLHLAEALDRLASKMGA